MKPGSTPYRAGEPVWVNRGGTFVRATLASNATCIGHHTEIDVTYGDGVQQVVGVRNIHRDGPEMQAWLGLLARQSDLLRALTEICQINGFTYGGKACQGTAEWVAYQANQDAARAAATAVFAVHPYER